MHAKIMIRKKYLRYYLVIFILLESNELAQKHNLMLYCNYGYIFNSIPLGTYTDTNFKTIYIL